MTIEEKINHPFYCVWCGEIMPDEQSFKKHYQNELDKMEARDAEIDVFNAVYNEKHY